MGTIETAGLALFGDSIAKGLGVRGRTYGQHVAESLGLELFNFSSSAMPVSESLAALTASDIRPEIAVIAHGITEPILRPSRRALRFIPARWRQEGWTDPRPYFSSHPIKKSLELTESAIRWRVKNVLLRADHPRQVLAFDTYSAALSALVHELQRRGSRVIILGAPDLDPRFFPGSAEEIAKYDEAARGLGVEHVPLGGVLARWSDFCADHFHPNDAGHSRIADVLLSAIREHTYA